MVIEVLNLMASGKTQIKYTKNNRDGESIDEFNIKCSDAPREEFGITMQKLIPFFLEFCEIDKKLLPKFEIKEISFGRTGDEQILNFQITCLKRLTTSATSIAIKSPLKYTGKASSSTDEHQIVDMKAKEAIYAALKECELYAQGERLQAETDI